MRPVRRAVPVRILLPVDIHERNGQRLARDVELVQRPRPVAGAVVAAVVAGPERIEPCNVDPDRVAAAPSLDDRVRPEEQLAGNLALEAPFVVSLEALRDERSGFDRTSTVANADRAAFVDP